MRKAAEIIILITEILGFIGAGALALLGLLTLPSSVGGGLLFIAIAALIAWLSRMLYVKPVKQRSMGWTIAGIVIFFGSVLGMVGYILLLIDIIQNDKN